MSIRALARLLGLLLLFAALFYYRLASATVTNDDYLHLSTAQQVVLGAVPVRDFLDPGELLFYSTSAAAQLLLGRSMLSEVLLDAFLLSLGQLLVFVLAARASRSTIVALLATAFPVVIVARLYSYPKTFLYAVALLLMWRYLDTRRLRVLWALGAWTAVAFLFRHDHGGCIAVTSAVMLAIAHERDRAALGRALAHFAVPIAVVVIPFLVFLQMNGGVAFYVRAMLDTARGEYERTASQAPALSLLWSGNPTAWHYWLTVSMPPATIVLLGVDWVRRHQSKHVAWRGMDHEAGKMVCAALLAALMQLFLLRAKSDSAIADVSALTGVLGAWLLARASAAGWLGSLAAAAVYVVAFRLLGPTAGGDQALVFVRMVQEGREPLAPRLESVRAMQAPYADEGARYLFSCTAESDRVLISSGYRPELYYAAGRGFAAGRLYYLNSLAPSPEFKAFSLDRLRAERVPIALLEPSDREFFDEFSGLAHYVQEHYRPAGQIEFWNTRFDVVVDARIPPTGTWAGGLPCYRAAAPRR